MDARGPSGALLVAAGAGLAAWSLALRLDDLLLYAALLVAVAAGAAGVVLTRRNDVEPVWDFVGFAAGAVVVAVAALTAWRAPVPAPVPQVLLAGTVALAAAGLTARKRR